VQIAADIVTNREFVAHDKRPLAKAMWHDSVTLAIVGRYNKVSFQDRSHNAGHCVGIRWLERCKFTSQEPVRLVH
jgi:hypothetical protein